VIPAYILAGVLVGPNPPTEIGPVSLALVSQSEFIGLLAELGVVFLLFFLGLEFSLDRLLANSGLLDLGVNLSIGIARGVVSGLGAIETLFLAGIVYISSSTVITKSLIENGWIANPEAEPILGTLVFEDVAIAIYPAVLSAIAFGGRARRRTARGFSRGTIRKPLTRSAPAVRWALPSLAILGHCSA
jgi:CPA2 family monovalent cation:H+ antiporter-2